MHTRDLDLVHIVDRIEHGNGGVCETNLLDTLILSQALYKAPSDYGVYSKEWGFWPVISRDTGAKDVLYYWNDEECKWMSG